MPLVSHHRFVWSGVFGPLTAPLETFQFSLKAPDDALLTESNLDTIAEGMSTCYATNLAPIMPTTVTLTGCEVAAIDELGKYKRFNDGAYVQGLWAGQVAGQTQGLPSFPLQTALTVSLVTSRPGPTGKGRFFLPWPAALLDAGFRLTDAKAQEFATVMAEFVRDVSLLAGPVSVYSSKGYSSVVTSVKVGRAPDTMRSRRGDLIEGYLSALV